MVVEFCGVIGCLLWLRLSKNSLQPRTVVLINLAIMSALPIYALLILRTKIEFFIVAAVYGLQVGAAQAFSRALFSDIIPKHLEGEFFSFFAVTDKS